MLLILTPSGTRLPTFKKNQYIIYILMVFWGMKQSVLLGVTESCFAEIGNLGTWCSTV